MSALRSARAIITLTALICASTASAATITVSLDLQGGYGNSTLKACGITHHYTLYRRGEPIKVDGAVSPAPTASIRVKLKLKQCLNGSFRTIWTGHARVATNGTYSGTFPARRPGSYFARAYYEGPTKVKSDKRYFRAT